MLTVDFTRLNIKPEFKILDIGCGTGRHTAEAYRYPRVKVVATDISYDNILKTNKRLEYHEKLLVCGGDMRGTLVSDITSLPFKDRLFDLIICSEVMEHIHDERSAFEELVRVLKPGKNLVISVPRHFPERICWVLSSDYRRSEKGHVRIYKKDRLIDYISKWGLKKWSIDYAHALHTPYWWLKCLVGLKRDQFILVKLYHHFLVWDMMKKPKITRLLERLLNPLIGKSLVIYLNKANRL